MSYTPPTAEISLLGSNQRLDESQRPSSLSLAHRKSDESFTIDKLQYDKCDFLGREQELKVLQEKYQQAQKVPSKQIVLVGGEPGVGKSALAQEVRKSVATTAGFLYAASSKMTTISLMEQSSTHAICFARYFPILRNDIRFQTETYKSSLVRA